MLSFLVLCGWIVGASKGFLFENTPVPANMFPGLPEIAKKQTGLALDVRIIVENPSDQQSMMALDGLSLALSGDEIRTSQNDRGDDDKDDDDREEDKEDESNDDHDDGRYV